MARTPGATLWPIGVYRQDSARYMNLWRWLRKFNGVYVTTEEELAEALTQPELFYLVPEEFR